MVGYGCESSATLDLVMQPGVMSATLMFLESVCIIVEALSRDLAEDLYSTRRQVSAKSTGTTVLCMSCMEKRCVCC